MVRVVEYTLNDPQRTGDGERHRLITNLLDEREVPAMELILLYHERWEQELVFASRRRTRIRGARRSPPSCAAKRPTACGRNSTLNRWATS